MMESQRRSFLKKSTLATLGLAGVSYSSISFPKIQAAIPEKLTVLFQGDSITDAGRNRSRYYPNDTWGGMGNGYSLLAAGHLMGEKPITSWKLYNRGISGHKVYQLAERWEDDCLQLKPDVLSILIGVNDFWHTLTNNYDATVEIYEGDLRKLLDRTLDTLPSIKLMIGEPFVILGGSAIEKDKWIPAFREYQQAAARVSKEYNAIWIPYQQVFDEALKSNVVDYWCPDGVHPSIGGNYLMAKAWLQGFEMLYK